MKKLLMVNLLMSFVISCSPKFEYTFDGPTISDSAIKRYLSDMDAVENFYSIIIFTQGFTNTNVKVLNGDVEVYDGNLNTIEGLGLANQLKINNKLETKIFDNSKKYSFELKREDTMRYKYIYIKKNSNGKYLVSFSNKLVGFK